MNLRTSCTSDLRDVSHDKHLRVGFNPFKMPPQHPPTPEDEARFHQHDGARPDNCAFQKVEILPGNIGYIKFNGFMDAGILRSDGECNDGDSWRTRTHSFSTSARRVAGNAAMVTHDRELSL